MVTFDKLSCLPKECLKSIFQSEIAFTLEGSGVIKEGFASMYLSKSLSMFQ